MQNVGLVLGRYDESCCHCLLLYYICSAPPVFCGLFLWLMWRVCGRVDTRPEPARGALRRDGRPVERVGRRRAAIPALAVRHRGQRPLLRCVERIECAVGTTKAIVPAQTRPRVRMCVLYKTKSVQGVAKRRKALRAILACPGAGGGAQGRGFIAHRTCTISSEADGLDRSLIGGGGAG